jgi:hypothetical protein
MKNDIIAEIIGGKDDKAKVSIILLIYIIFSENSSSLFEQT